MGWTRAATAIGTAVLDLMLPAACAACGALGTAVCSDCLAELEAVGPIACRSGVTALAHHEGAARELVLAFKDRGRRDLARPLGEALARVLPRVRSAEPVDGVRWLVPVPSRPTAARMRGGAHVTALARWCARALAADGEPVAVAPALRLSNGVRDAVGLSRAQRAANLAGRVRVDPAGAPPPGVGVVLVDDVVTTGATLEACGAALAGVGVEVRAAVTLTSAR